MGCQANRRCYGPSQYQCLAPDRCGVPGVKSLASLYPPLRIGGRAWWTASLGRKYVVDWLVHILSFPSFVQGSRGQLDKPSQLP